MTDLIAILGSLVDVKGKILVPGINDSVAPLTTEEQKLYEPIDFDTVRVLFLIHAITCTMGLKEGPWLAIYNKLLKD